MTDTINKANDSVRVNIRHVFTAFTEVGANRLLKTVLARGAHSPSLMEYNGIKYTFTVENEGWEPNWGDFSEYKYFPWFEFERNSTADTGFGFSYCDWTDSRTYTLVGARLCFKTSELAKYAGTQFTDLYRDYMV